MAAGVSRREFLKGLGLAALGALAGCVPVKVSSLPPTLTSAPSPATVPPTAQVTAAPTSPPTSTPPLPPTVPPTATSAATVTPRPTLPPTETPVPPTATSVPSPPPTDTVPPPKPFQVAIEQVAGYDRALVRQRMEAMFDGLGGLTRVVRPGATVAIKVNLTGGMHFSPPAGLSAVESYLTHPEVVRVLGELLRDAGAGSLFIVEAVFDAESFAAFGYEEVARYLGASLVDLNGPAPYADFVSVPVGDGWLAYESFVFNPLLTAVDVFVSVAKMKCHYNCGVTLAMKNLIGLVPTAYYRLADDHWWRSALHGRDEAEAGTRLPRVIVDLNRARPVHLAVIDGVKTVEGGEVPRGGSFAPVSPGVLVAGWNAVATDAVATAVMGFDPTGDYPTAPFLHGGNHLNLAAGMGLGSNRLEEISVVGVPIEAVRHPFVPA